MATFYGPVLPQIGNLRHLIDASSGNDVDLVSGGGTINYTGTFNYTDGHYYFSGSSTYMVATDYNKMQFNGPTTISVWARPTTLASVSDGRIACIFQIDNGSVETIDFGLADSIDTGLGDAKFFVSMEESNGVDHPVIGSTTIVTDNWYHLCMVEDGSYVRLYVNGKQEGYLASSTWTRAGGSISTINVAAGSTQGGGYYGSGDRFIGYLNNLAMWQTALTADEVKYLYESTKSRYTETSL